MIAAPPARIDTSERPLVGHAPVQEAGGAAGRWALAQSCISLKVARIPGAEGSLASRVTARICSSIALMTGGSVICRSAGHSSDSSAAA